MPERPSRGGRLARELDPGEVAELRELTALPEPLDPQPVIQSLERQVDLFVEFQLDHGQAIARAQAGAARRAQDVDHAAVPLGRRRTRERRHLWIDAVR